MENVSFKQRFDKRAKYVTFSVLLICIGIAVWLYLRSSASFISAWFILLSISMVLLFWIGMPRKTILTEYGLRISCTLRLITIDYVDQIAIEHISSRSFPLFSTLGFMGYVGFYYFRGEKMFAYVITKNMNNLVCIRYGNRKIVIGVPDVNDFLKTAQSYGYKIIQK